MWQSVSPPKLWQSASPPEMQEEFRAVSGLPVCVVEISWLNGSAILVEFYLDFPEGHICRGLERGLRKSYEKCWVDLSFIACMFSSSFTISTLPRITLELVRTCLTENLKAYFPCYLCRQAKWMPAHKFIVKNLYKLHSDHYSDKAVHTLDISSTQWSAQCENDPKWYK